jgi:hypothetical protein
MGRPAYPVRRAFKFPQSKARRPSSTASRRALHRSSVYAQAAVDKPIQGLYNYLRLFQNFSFWNSFLEFDRKTGLLAGFPRACSETNRVLEQAHLSVGLFQNQPGFETGIYTGIH